MSVNGHLDVDTMLDKMLDAYFAMETKVARMDRKLDEIQATLAALSSGQAALTRTVNSLVKASKTPPPSAKPRAEEVGDSTAPVSIAEAAKMLGVSRWTMYRMLDDGRLRALRIGGVQKIRRSEIEAYIVRQERLAKKERWT